jgi:hypothetical protein
MLEFYPNGEAVSSVVARFGTIRRLLQAAGTSYPNWSDLVLEKFRQFRIRHLISYYCMHCYYKYRCNASCILAYPHGGFLSVRITSLIDPTAAGSPNS